jgi:CRP/FNR family cyclic AMP-dependent transcriptional regulator
MVEPGIRRRVEALDRAIACSGVRVPSCGWRVKGEGMFRRHGVPRSRIELLGQVPFFEGLSKKVLARIDSHVDEVQIPAGSKLTEQGSGAFEAFVIADGEAEVKVGDEVVGHTSIGELIGEIGVLKHTLRTATVTATTPMRLLVINPREMTWLFEDPKLAARVQQNLDKHLQGPQPHSATDQP